MRLRRAPGWRGRALMALALSLAACGGGGSDGPSASTSTTTGIGTIYQRSAAATTVAAIDPTLGTVTTSQITSSNTGGTYTVSLYTPAAAASSSAAFPIVYSADGQYLFTDIVASLQAQRVDAYVVSVNYVDANERAADYLLPGAAAYFRFFTQELMPGIEARLRIDPSRRSLFGYSYSGVFALVAMFYDDPSNRRFSGIVPIDGSFFTDPTDIDALEAQAFVASPQLKVGLYMSCSPSQGSNPGNCASALPMFALIANQGFKGVAAAEFDDYVDGNHSTVVAPAVQAAIGGLFAAK